MKLLLAAAALSGLIVLNLSGCKSKQNAAPAAEPLPVKTVAVHAADEPRWIEMLGQAEGGAEVEVRAQVSGILKRLNYQEGDFVKAGDVLFEIEDAPFKARLDSARSTRKQYADELAQAERELKRTSTLYKTGAASRASLNPGSLIDASSSLLATITQHDDVRITFAPSDRDLGESKVTLESAVRVFTKNGKEIPAKLDYVAKSLDPSVGTRLMRAALSADHPVIPGEFVTVRLMVDVDKQAYRVPQKAVMQRPDGTYCVYVAADGKARLRTVTVGLWEGTDWIVRSGLKDGDLIITNQLLRLQEGSPIRLSANEAPTEKH